MSLSVVVLFDFVLLLFCLFRLVVVCLFLGGERHTERKRERQRVRETVGEERVRQRETERDRETERQRQRQRTKETKLVSSLPFLAGQFVTIYTL